MSKEIFKIGLKDCEKRNLNKIVPFISNDIYKKVAGNILKQKHGNILLITGFWCFGSHETDGPIGTLFLAKALNKLGFKSIILTESFSKNVYEKYDIDVVYIDENKPRHFYENLYKKYNPSAVISVERAGRADNQKYNNMRMKDISENTYNLDELFLIANDVYKVGIGDGGNEVGMGLIKHHVDEDFGIIPASVKADDLIIATVSNWGAYGLIALLEFLSNKNLLPSFNEIKESLEYMNSLGLVDGVTGGFGTVDSFDIAVDKEILNQMREELEKMKNTDRQILK